MWNSDIGTVVKEEIGVADWATFREEANKQYGHAGKLNKNSLHIAAILNMAWDAGNCSPSLERLCNALLVPE